MTDIKRKKLKSKFATVCLPALFCCLLWGSAFPCIKIGYRLFNIAGSDTASQILFAGMRFLPAGIMVILFESITTRKLLLPNKSAMPKIITVSLFQTILQYAFFYVGLSHTGGVRASVIIGSNVFLSLIMSALVFRLERFTFVKAVGCVVGFAGVALINLSSGSVGGFNLLGDGLIFAAAVCSAASTTLIKIFSQKENPIMISGYQFAFGGLVLIIAGLITGGSISEFSVGGILMLIYLAFVSAAAYTVWSILLKNNEVSTVTVYGFANPVFGVILSALLLGESNNAFSIIGIISVLLVSVGIVTVNLHSKDKLGVENDENI